MLLRIQNLCLSLERMEILYGRCLEILERERRFLILMDFDNLFVVMREKDEVLAALKALDRDRLRTQDVLAAIMQTSAAELTLKTLGESLVNEGGNSLEAGWRLLAQRERLNALIDQLKIKLHRNNLFIEKSMNNLQQVAAHLSALVAGKSSKPVGPLAKTYTGKAKMTTPNENAGSIMEKRL